MHFAATSHDNISAGLLSIKRPTALLKYWLAQSALLHPHHLVFAHPTNMTGNVGKLSRGPLSHNKSYKPDGRKAYARAALKCT